MELRSDNKKINQYLIHANEIESFENGKLVEFERGLDAGYAILKDSKVIELFVRQKREFKAFKNERDIKEIIDELNEDWLINKI